jgi:hypothetical protein
VTCRRLGCSANCGMFRACLRFSIGRRFAHSQHGACCDLAALLLGVIEVALGILGRRRAVGSNVTGSCENQGRSKVWLWACNPSFLLGRRGACWLFATTPGPPHRLNLDFRCQILVLQAEPVGRLTVCPLRHRRDELFAVTSPMRFATVGR